MHILQFCPQAGYVTIGMDNCDPKLRVGKKHVAILMTELYRPQYSNGCIHVFYAAI